VGVRTNTRSLAFEAHGVTVALELLDPALGEQAELALPAGAVRIPVDEGIARLPVDRWGRVGLATAERPPDAGPSEAGIDRALARLAAELRLHIAEQSPEVFIHAGAVAVAGAALILPGSSYAGKSTLIAALLRAGAQYLSDEYAVIDERGFVRPFDKPLSLRDADDRVGRPVPAAALGAVTVTDATPPRLIVLTRYRPGAGWEPRPISRAEAFMAVVEHTVPLRAQSERAMRRVRLVCDLAPALDSARDDAEPVAEDLMQRMRQLADEGQHRS
jgi:hypothetical protein